MVITRTPFRISFFGGGTDYPAWYRQHGGAVLATTIDKYCYITCRKLPPFFDHKHRIVYSRIESVRNISDIKHPSVRATFDWAEIEEGLEIHHDGDLPARSGLGSSSAFTVGLVNALGGLMEKPGNAHTLAKNAIHIEQNLIGENVGSQDQISAAYGGFNRINFHQDDTFDVIPMNLAQERKKELKDHLMLCFTGLSRIADEIAGSQLANFKQRESELLRIRSIVDEGESILSSQESIESFGRLLDESWQHKQSLSNMVSTPHIDQLYRAAREAGAIGGKILGAGGGGFLLLFAKPEHHEKIKVKLNKLVHVDFNYDDSGSQVVMSQTTGF